MLWFHVRAAFVENHEGFASYRSPVDGGWRSEPALQPDGGYLARVLREPDATALVANFRQYVEHNREAGAGALLTSPDGQSVAIGQRDGALTIRTLATAADKKVSLWQAASGRYLAELEGGGMGNVLLLHFSADGRTLVHGSYPALHLWRTEESFPLIVVVLPVTGDSGR